MKYDKKAIGKRIKEERIKVGFKSQGAFANRMGYAYESRQTVANWEKGKTMPCFEDILTMCDIFKCELGYLLCEYDCKKRDTADIQKIIGLSEDAIEKLSVINKTEIRDILITLSKIIEHKDFIDFLQAIHNHIWNFNRNQIRLNDINNENIAKAMNCKTADVRKYVEASSKSLIEYDIMKIIEDIK